MSADLAIVKTLRLMQITAGIFSNEDGVITVLKTELEKELKNLLEEICANPANKVIIWTVFVATYDLIAELCKSLNINYTFLTGRQNKDEKQDNVDAFNEDPKVQVIIANQGAGGTGVNLTAANYDIYYTWDFSLEKHLQSGARAYRGGQTRKYTSYKLVTKDSIAEKSLYSLKAKAKGAEDILAVKEFSRSEILGFI
jgi:SNF2 family DNA or RNA helicase